MALWQELIDAGYFVDGANAYDWVDAADQVANGEAAVTLMGTWIGGYWKGQELVPGEDYDFFDFPAIDDVPQAGVGPIDGWVMTANADAASAGALMEFLVNDVDTQTLWNTSYGSLSPNVNVDPMVYDAVAAKAGASIANAAVYAFNYDLATTPPGGGVRAGHVLGLHGRFERHRGDVGDDAGLRGGGFRAVSAGH